MTIDLDFAIGSSVHLDGLTDMRGAVTAISIQPGGVTYEVCWWNEREHRSAWFQPAHLSAVEEHSA